MKANKPLHGFGPHGKPMHKAPLKAGAHMPMRDHSGVSDAQGYSGSPVRRNGEHTGGLMGGDTRVRKGPEGNSKGSAPPNLAKVGKAKMAKNSNTSSRGAKGSPSEEISHSQFERLGA